MTHDDSADHVARSACSDAERAGLLSAERFEQWLREQLKAQRIGELFAAMDRMAAGNAMPPMSPEEVAEEIATMRAERRATRGL